jgi:hypothetical protein
MDGSSQTGSGPFGGLLKFRFAERAMISLTADENGARFVYLRVMRYLVKARVKRGQEKALLRAVANGSLGRGSIAGDEYLYDMEKAASEKMEPRNGWRYATAQRHCRRNALTGKNSSN